MPRKTDKVVVLENSRNPAQTKHMQNCAATGTCPFCDIDRKVNKLSNELRVGKHWRVMKNAFPYPEHRHHIILTPIRHVTDILDLTCAEWAEWASFNTWAIEKFKIPGGGLVMRFGDPKYSACTVAHLHSHIMVPNGKRFSVIVLAKDPDFVRFMTRADRKYKLKQAAAATAKRLKKKK